MFVVAAQRLEPSQRFSSSFIIFRTRLFIVCRCCATFEAFATFLVIVYSFQDTAVHCLSFASQRLKPSQRFSSSFIVHYLMRSCFNVRSYIDERLGEKSKPDTNRPSYRGNQPVPWYLRVHLVHLFDALRRVRPRDPPNGGSPRGRTNKSALTD